VHDIVRRTRLTGAKRVLLDGLVPIRDGLVDRIRLPYLINALSQQLRNMGATVLYTIEIRELGLESIMPSDELSAMIDNILLFNITRHEQGARRYLSVVKVRSRDFDPHTQPFHIGGSGFSLGPDERLQTVERTG
jgi:circadian clock protein KaiC